MFQKPHNKIPWWNIITAIYYICGEKNFYVFRLPFFYHNDQKGCNYDFDDL